MTFYVDGVSYAGSNSLAGNPGHTATILGAFNPGGSTPCYFGGGMDNVLMYSRALGPSEVTALYNLSPIMTANGAMDFGSQSVYANGARRRGRRIRSTGPRPGFGCQRAGRIIPIQSSGGADVHWPGCHDGSFRGQ